MRMCAYALQVCMRVSMRAYFPRHEREALVQESSSVGTGAKTCGTASRQQGRVGGGGGGGGGGGFIDKQRMNVSR